MTRLERVRVYVTVLLTLALCATVAACGRRASGAGGGSAAKLSAKAVRGGGMKVSAPTWKSQATTRPSRPATTVPTTRLPAGAKTTVPATQLAAGSKRHRRIPIRVGTSSHSILGRLRHVYSEDELREFLAQPGDDVMAVVHGIEVGREHPDWVKQFLHIEVRPVWTSSERTIPGLSKEQVSAVLTGRISNWRDLGEPSGPIHVYLHGGELQRRSFEAACWSEQEIDPRALRSCDPRYFDTYERLAAAAARDRNAFVMGLKQLDLEGLRTVAVDGVSIHGAADHVYPLESPVFITWKRNDPAAREVRGDWLDLTGRIEVPVSSDVGVVSP